MKSIIHLWSIILFILFSFACYSQDTLNDIDPIQIQEVNEKLEKLKKAIEMENAVSRVNTSNNEPQHPSQLDDLVKSLQPVTDHSVNTNPATGAIAPSGIYNTSDTSKILIDEELINDAKKSNHAPINNISNLLIIISMLVACILGLVGYIIWKN